MATVLTVLLGAASADAKKRHKKPKAVPVTVVSTSKSTSSNNQQVTVTAICPSGLIAVGGGFQAPPLLDAGTPTDLHIVYESRRAGANGWQVSAVRDDMNGSGPDLPVTASADCRSTKLAVTKPAKKATMTKKKKRKLTIAEVSSSATGAPNSGAQASATATCPPNTQALGGGFSSSPAPSLGGGASFPFFWSDHRSSPTTWFAALSNSGLTARTVTSYAYCAAGLKISETNASVPLAGSGPTASSATASAPPCPRGKALLGGGFDNTPASSTSAVALLTGSRQNGAWQVDAFNFNDFAGTLGSSAYCA
jgi:hypothetical protein